MTDESVIYWAEHRCQEEGNPAAASYVNITESTQETSAADRNGAVRCASHLPEDLH
jgi:hypothetical protein